jgi:thiol-disulfide isomerase/thioredoxin
MKRASNYFADNYFADKRIFPAVPASQALPRANIDGDRAGSSKEPVADAEIRDASMDKSASVNTRSAMVRRIALLGALFATPAAMASTTAPDAFKDCALHLTVGGIPADLGQFRGKVLYVDFWASWCVPCLLSFPFMNDLQSAYGPRGLQVVAVNMDDKPGDMDKFLDKHPASFAVGAGPNGPCAKALGVATMPTSFLIGRDGAVHSSHAGFRTDDAAPLRTEVEGLLSENAAQ